MYTTAYKYKVYRQNANHERRLGEALDVACDVYNHVITLKSRHYSLYHKDISEYDMKKHLTKVKRTFKQGWNAINTDTIQHIVEHIYRAYDSFFKHAVKRPPRHRSRRRWNSLPLKGTGWKLDGDTLHINKQRLKLRLFLSRPIEGEIRTVTLKRDSVGDWWAVFVVRRESDGQAERITSGKAAGADFGLLHFLTLDDGATVDAPTPLKASLKELKSKSRKLSKKVKGSNNRRKARVDLARIHRRVANQRSDFQWKLALSLARAYDTICVEDLNISGMRRLWGRKVSDLAYHSFLQKLEWECQKHFKELVRVDRFEPTSKVCSCCGH
ncbi:MAG: transposase, partial [Bacteroidales bacterium]|nr:transposase [Bacteroidales bacterium]